MLRNLANDQGSSLVEYAIVFVVFMSMLLGIGSFGQALYVYHFLSHEAREATRWAAVNGSTCASDVSCAQPAQPADIQSYVTSRVPMGIDASKVAVNENGLAFWPSTACGNTPTPGCCGTAADNGAVNAPGCTVQVKVSYPLTFLFPLAPSGTWKLSSTSEMVIAH